MFMLVLITYEKTLDQNEHDYQQIWVHIKTMIIMIDGFM